MEGRRGLTAYVRWTWNQDSASAVVEITNRSPISIGLVVTTKSIWGLAQAEIFNRCGGKYVQGNSPYDSLAGISKEMNAPTWIAPGGTLMVTMQPNTRVGNACALSHLTVSTMAFRPGQSVAQPLVVYAPIE
jgi:hypothetical protein